MMPIASRAIIALLLASAIFAVGCHPSRRHRPASRSAAAQTLSAKNPSAARALTERAYDLIQKNDFKSARPLLERAIMLDPAYGPAHNDLGVIDYRTARLYDAAWHFENAIKLMPRQPEPANNLGLVLESAGKFADAEKQYDAASAMDLHNVEFAANRARIRIRQGNVDALTRQLLEYIALYDRRPEWVEWARLNLSRFRSN